MSERTWKILGYIVTAVFLGIFIYTVVRLVGGM